MNSSYKAVQYVHTSEELLEYAKERLQALKEECETAAGNFPSSDHPKAVQFQNAAEALADAVGYLDDFEFPEQYNAGQELKVWLYVPRRRAHHASKQSRRDNACTALATLYVTLADEDGEPLVDARATAEAVEFPGMFG